MTLKIQRVWYALLQLHALSYRVLVYLEIVSWRLFMRGQSRTVVSHGIYLRRYQQCSFANCWNMMRVIQMINVTNNNARLTYPSFYRMNGPKMIARMTAQSRILFFLLFYFSLRHQFCIRLYLDKPRFSSWKGRSSRAALKRGSHLIFNVTPRKCKLHGVAALDLTST